MKALIHYIDNSLKNDHYVVNMFSKKRSSNIWLRYNDLNIEEVSDEVTFSEDSQKTAYRLLYEREYQNKTTVHVMTYYDKHKEEDDDVQSPYTVYSEDVLKTTVKINIPPVEPLSTTSIQESLMDEADILSLYSTDPSSLRLHSTLIDNALRIIFRKHCSDWHLLGGCSTKKNGTGMEENSSYLDNLRDNKLYVQFYYSDP